MSKNVSLHPPQLNMPTSIEEWNALDKVLLSYIKNCLYTYQVYHWKGSESEMANDVLQETYLRVLRSTIRDPLQEEDTIVHNFEAFCKTVARRYVLDLLRKDKRFVGSLDDENFANIHISIQDDPAEGVLEDLHLYSIMLTFSEIVKSFPEKQKIAILIDLAHHTDFDDDHPQPLVRAMQAVGIHLRDYYCPLPQSPVLRSRHSALVCLAYQRLRLAFTCTSSQCSSAA